MLKKHQTAFTPLEITGKNRHQVKSRKFLTGFTLIELLVVIAIIGLLASIVLVALNSTRAKTRDVRRRADLKQIQTAVELYYDDNNTYPGTFGTYYWISDNNYPGTGAWPPCETTTGGLKPYLPNVCSIKDTQGNVYDYAKKADGSYKLGARFELVENQGIPFTYGAGNSPHTGWYEPK